MNRNENYILNRLDKPLRFLGVNKDEAFTLLLPILGGFTMGWILSGILIGIGSLSFLRVLKKKNEGAALIHAVYWYLPSSQKALKLPAPSHIREYIGQ